MADDDTRFDSGAVGTREQPPPEPEASTTGPGHPAQDAAPVPDSIAQPGQALPQNTTIAPATTTTTLPLGTGPGLEARMPLTEDDATIAHDSAAVAEGNDAAERHHQAPQAGQGNTAATAPHDAAQETSSIGQAAQNPDIVPLLPSETAAIQSSGVSEMPVGGETQAQADLTPMPDPASALHHHPPPEPATDAAPPPAAASAGELPVPHFVAPSSYLRPKTSQRRGHPPTAAMASHEHRPPPGPYDKEQLQGLKAIRDFLKVRTSYDVLPLSFRLIVLDTNLLIKKSLNILIQNSIVSAPLWDSQGSKFAGILTSTDYLNVIRYYCTFPDEMHELDQFRLSSLRAIEKAIGAIPIETVSVHPSRPLYEACERMLKTRARRIPLVDTDDETGQEMVVSVITQYRILKFIAVNNEHNTVMLKKSVREIGLGTYDGLLTANMMTSILDAVGMMVDQNISCIPIVDKNNIVLNVFEAVDIIPCIKGGAYEELDGTVGDALCKRSDDSPGIYTCSQDDRLESIFDTIRKSRVHRLIVVDDDNRLKGVISLSDILKYVLLYGEDDHSMWR